MDTIEHIAILQMKNGDYETPFVLIEDKFQNRESYKEGYFTDEVDLSIYDKIMEEDNDWRINWKVKIYTS